MARNYSQNLSEETIKGMTEKARSGLYFSFVPVGYLNVDGPNGKRIITPDSEATPAITEIFETFSQGNHSVKALVRELNERGVRLRGRKLGSSVVHQILRKRLYTGDFDWDGKVYNGLHDPLVSYKCWAKVQAILDSRAEKKTRKVKHDFAYTGLIQCGHCGCLLVGELKKGTYVYYPLHRKSGKVP